jgi:DNA-binding HxlR family transcriptional regulator
VVSDRSTFLVMREVCTGVHRFDDIRVRTGMARQVLSDRLTKLVHEGLLWRHPYQEPGQRPRHEYRLTEKGFDLYLVVVALLDWGSRYMAGPAGRRLSSGIASAARWCTRCCAARRDLAPRSTPPELSAP